MGFLDRSKMSACLRIKRKKEKETDSRGQSSFIKNGGLLLEKLIAIRNEKRSPVRNFSAEQLKSATNNYDERQILHEAGDCKLYKGTLQDRPICIKKFVAQPERLRSDVNEIAIATRMSIHKKDDGYIFYKGTRQDKPVCIKKFFPSSSKYVSLAINEIANASQVSAHKHVLKLLGCCLETEIPILVYEFVQNGTLSDRLYGSDRQPLPWKCRLRIARDIAHAVAYLHAAFSRPIIHRDIKPSNILLDQQNVAKLSDFSLCISIPEGKQRVKDAVCGTIGFIAPEYATTGYISEKSDVFAFGVLLLVLLTAQIVWDQKFLHNDFFLISGRVKYHVENNRFNEIVDSRILEETLWSGTEQQLQDFTALAFRCINENEEDRPTMINVAKILGQMEKSSHC
ncbi:serine/threonine-protein kinase ZRK1-like [Malania oleifera]|uniref:serine/threonine-protein kinase ZRK1-like n=1 Tax=Malania oleifera TaxID=397392 RepID=UPI0025AE7D24|nr:serine/threonine-protein kinase ZRK1-like [Malania oleifera]